MVDHESHAGGVGEHRHETIVDLRRRLQQNLATELALYVDAELVFGEKLKGIRNEVLPEEVIAFETGGHGEPEGAGLGRGAFVFDAGSPGFAARFLPVLGGPREFKAAEGNT